MIDKTTLKTKKNRAKEKRMEKREIRREERGDIPTDELQLCTSYSSVR